MFSKRVILQCIVFVFTIINAFGQNPEYAYLVKTEITGYLHANNGSLSIKTNLGSIGSGNYFATASNVGNVYFDFMQLQDDFTQSTISIYNYAIRIANYPDCNYTREETILKEDFNNRSYLNYGGCSFQQRVYPLHIVGTDNTDPVCSLTTINLKGGYDWEYQIGNGGWKTLASATQSVNINIGDIYADNGIDINELSTSSAERSIHFQTGHKASNKFVAPRTYTITGCSPVFVEYYDKTKTSCSYKTDGKIAIKLNRNIDSSKERLVVTLYKSDRVLIGQEHTTNSLIPLNATNYGYIWTNDIDAGTYYFLYQTQNINLDIPTAPEIDDGSSWDKLVKTPSFTIEKATNVDFTAILLNDENCFKAGDGKIQVEVTSGETGRSYSYIVYKVEGTTETVERNWTSFSGTTIVISGLGKGDYKIKVKDNEGCLAKE